jgi:hypothetical protein
MNTWFIHLSEHFESLKLSVRYLNWLQVTLWIKLVTVNYTDSANLYLVLYTFTQEVSSDILLQVQPVDELLKLQDELWL